MQTKNIFHIHGYHRDYYVRGKYVGFVKMTEPDREKFGYSGKQESILAEPIEIQRSAGGQMILPDGCQVTTECIPICGRIVGESQAERIQVLKQHYLSSPYKRKFK